MAEEACHLSYGNGAAGSKCIHGPFTNERDSLPICGTEGDRVIWIYTVHERSCLGSHSAERVSTYTQELPRLEGISAEGPCGVGVNDDSGDAVKQAEEEGEEKDEKQMEQQEETPTCSVYSYCSNDEDDGRDENQKSLASNIATATDRMESLEGANRCVTSCNGAHILSVKPLGVDTLEFLVDWNVSTNGITGIRIPPYLKKVEPGTLTILRLAERLLQFVTSPNPELTLRDYLMTLKYDHVPLRGIDATHVTSAEADISSLWPILEQQLQAESSIEQVLRVLVYASQHHKEHCIACGRKTNGISICHNALCTYRIQTDVGLCDLHLALQADYAKHVLEFMVSVVQTTMANTPRYKIVTLLTPIPQPMLQKDVNKADESNELLDFSWTENCLHMAKEKEWQEKFFQASSNAELEDIIASTWNCKNKVEIARVFCLLHWFLQVPYRCGYYPLMTTKSEAGVTEGSESPSPALQFKAYKHQQGKDFDSEMIPVYHGSPAANAWSILHQGLIQLSGTKYMNRGAAHGHGIYFATDRSVSRTYAGKNGILLEARLNIRAPGVSYREGIDYYVVTNRDAFEIVSIDCMNVQF